MYGNYRNEDPYGDGHRYDYNQQHPSVSAAQMYSSNQRQGGQQAWMQNAGRDFGGGKMASAFDVQRGGQSHQSSHYDIPSNSPHIDNNPPVDKTARAYAFLAKVDEDQKRHDELEEQKREVERLRNQVKSTMQTLHHLQGGVETRDMEVGGWQQQMAQPPVKSILKKPKRIDGEDVQIRTNYCDVCSIQFNTTREYQQHCSGLLHTKQIMQKKMGITIDKQKEETPLLREQQSWSGRQQRAGGQQGNPPVDLNAIYSAFDDYDDDVDTSASRQPKHQEYVSGGNVHCVMCDQTFYTNEEMRNHSATTEHCKKFLVLQNSLGTEKFMSKYSDVPFEMVVKPLNAACERQRCNDLPHRDVKDYKEFLARSGTLNALQCRVCSSNTFLMEHWFSHCTGKKHTKACINKMQTMSAEAYLKEFGDLPGPIPTKSSETKVSNWECVFFLDRLKSPPKMSILQEQQAAQDLHQLSRQQSQDSGYHRGPQTRPAEDSFGHPGMSQQGMHGSNYQDAQTGNHPGLHRQPLLGEAPSVHSLLQAKYEEQQKAQAGGAGGGRPEGPFGERRPAPGFPAPYGRPGPPDRVGAFDTEPGAREVPYENPFNQSPGQRNAPNVDVYGQMDRARHGMPAPGQQDYRQGRGGSRSHEELQSREGPHVHDFHGRERDYGNRNQGMEPYPPNRNADQPPRDRLSRERSQDPPFHDRSRDIPPYDRSRDPSSHDRSRDIPPYDRSRDPSSHDRFRESSHDRSRDPSHDRSRDPSSHDRFRDPTHDRFRDPTHDRSRDPHSYDRSRDPPPHDRPPHDRPPHDRPPHDRPPHDRPPHNRPPHDRSPHDRPPHDRPPHDRPPHQSHHDLSSNDHRDRQGQPNNLYDPFESEAPKAAPADQDKSGGVVPTAKALQMLHQIQEKQRLEQEKLEKQLRKQQELLDKQKRELERERQKHQKELERQQKELKEKQLKLEEEKRQEEKKRREKEKELEREKKLRLEEKRRQLQMKDDLERKRLQKQREDLERKRKEKMREEEERRKREEREKEEEQERQRKLKEELQQKVQHEMEARRQEKLKQEIEERLKAAELQKMKEKEAELERLTQAKKLELEKEAARGRGAGKKGRGRGGWRPVTNTTQYMPRPAVQQHPIPSHLIPVPRAMVGVHMGMRPAYPAASRANSNLVTISPATTAPGGDAGLANSAPWNSAALGGPPTAPGHAPWNKGPDTKPKQAPSHPPPAAKAAVAPPWSAGKGAGQADKQEKSRNGGPESNMKRGDMPWKRKEESRSRGRQGESSERSRQGEGSERDAGRAGGRRTPPDLHQAAPWHARRGPEDKAAPWEAASRRPGGKAVDKDAPWASRRSGADPVEPGHTYKLVLSERDQTLWKNSQAGFIRCMDSGENTSRPLKLFTNTLQMYMRRIQDAKDRLPEREILATLSAEEQEVTKQIQRMTGLKPPSVVTCTLHLLQAMDPRVFNILGSMDPNFMQSLISDAMSGSGDRDQRRSRSRSPPSRGPRDHGDRDHGDRDARDAPPWMMRSAKRPMDQPEADKRGRWA